MTLSKSLAICDWGWSSSCQIASVLSAKLLWQSISMAIEKTYNLNANTILLSRKVTFRLVLLFLTWSLLTCIVTLHQPCSQWIGTWRKCCGYGWISCVKDAGLTSLLPFSSASQSYSGSEHWYVALFTASFWEKPRTKEEGGENHNTSCCASFIVLP